MENVFSEPVTSAMKFSLILPENFPYSFTCTDHDQDLHRHQYFPKMLIFCSTFETKCSMEELEAGLNQLLLSTTQLVSAQVIILWVIQCISSCTYPASPFPSEQQSWKLVCRSLAVWNLLKINIRIKKKIISVAVLGWASQWVAVEKFSCWPLTKQPREFHVHTNKNNSHHWDISKSWSLMVHGKGKCAHSVLEVRNAQTTRPYSCFMTDPEFGASPRKQASLQVPQHSQ